MRYRDCGVGHRESQSTRNAREDEPETGTSADIDDEQELDAPDSHGDDSGGSLGIPNSDDEGDGDECGDEGAGASEESDSEETDGLTDDGNDDGEEKSDLDSIAEGYSDGSGEDDI
jgi:hypothetical protein